MLIPNDQCKDHPVRTILFHRRISYLEVSKAIGYHPRTIGWVVAGRMPVTTKFASRMSAYLGLPAEELFLSVNGRRKSG